MKRILILLLLAFCLTGCDDVMNTPTKQVEKLFAKYQMVDSDINEELDQLLDTDDFDLEQQESYRNIIEKQYKNLTYTIKDEEVNGDNAIVTAEIEVIDYKKEVDALDSEYSTLENADTTSYINEKINRLKNANDKVKYTLELEVTKDQDGNWQINSLKEEDIKKIQGMY